MCVQCHQPTSAIGGSDGVAQPTSEATAETPDASAPEATEAPPQPASGPPAIPHPLDGRDNCLACHAAGGPKPFPADHEGRTADQCQMCHQPAEAQAPAATTEPAAAGQQTTPEAAATTAASGEGSAATTSAAPQIPHDIAGQENQCLACHYTGSIKPFPSNHEGYSNAMCLSCHQPKS